MAQPELLPTRRPLEARDIRPGTIVWMEREGTFATIVKEREAFNHLVDLQYLGGNMPVRAGLWPRGTVPGFMAVVSRDNPELHTFLRQRREEIAQAPANAETEALAQKIVEAHIWVSGYIPLETP